jgi:hypothetical protein
VQVRVVQMAQLLTKGDRAKGWLQDEQSAWSRDADLDIRIERIFECTSSALKSVKGWRS